MSRRTKRSQIRSRSAGALPGPWSATLITARGNPEMTFRIAGVVDLAVVAPVGATVTVEFVNADSDQAPRLGAHH